MAKVRTRFAPSPTGYMHIGNLRTALYEYLIAKSQGGDFILRIEDTDQEREVEGAVDIIYKTLEQTGLTYDEGPDKDKGFGPYVQSQRLPMYKSYADKLVDLGGAHYCFCSECEIQKQRDFAADHGIPFKFVDPCHSITKEQARERIAAGEEYVVRQTVPNEGITYFDDEVYGHIEVENSTLDEMILLKSDGFPTYNFANVVDDHQMEISHVVRGNEYLSSTPKYNLIYRAYGWEPPVYVHVPPVMKDEQHKLSKRNGDASFQDLVKKGYLPEAIMNYIALLGWSPETEEEIYSLADLEKVFSIERISKSPSIFDIGKLTWMNGVYIRNLPLDKFHELALPYYQAGIKRDVDLKEISLALQPRVETLGAIANEIDFYDEPYPFDANIYTHKKMKTNPENSLEALEWSREVMANVDDYTNDELLMKVMMDLAVEKGVKNGRIMWPIRVALSNKPQTAGGAVEIAHILGKEETLRRFDLAIAQLKEYLGK